VESETRETRDGRLTDCTEPNARAFFVSLAH